MVALVESLKIGMKALGISANAQLDEPDEEISGKTWGFTVFLSLAFAIGLFFVLPVTVASFWKDQLGNSVAFVVVEKLIRISIFLGYSVGDLAASATCGACSSTTAPSTR